MKSGRSEDYRKFELILKLAIELGWDKILTHVGPDGDTVDGILVTSNSELIRILEAGGIMLNRKKESWII